MLNRLANAAKTWVVVGVGALVLALSAFFILSNLSPDSIFAQVPSDPVAIEYDENGTGSVATFTSADPENAGSVHWDVTGVDAADFEINSSGELRFNTMKFPNGPNYESPTDRMHAALDRNNDGDPDDTADGTDLAAAEAGDRMYQIMVRATERRVSGQERALSTERYVTVSVQNVDEPGMVELRWLEPEVHTEIMATLTDPDCPDGFATCDDGSALAVTWTWHISKVSGTPNVNTDNHWTDVTDDTDTRVTTAVTQETGDTTSYTPLGVDADYRTDDQATPVEGAVMHEGKFLRAVATYTDPVGAEMDTTRGMSANQVRAERTTGDPDDENGSPDFEPDTITIDMAEDAEEGDDVGNAIVAKDPNRTNPTDILTYELVQPATRTPAGRVYDVDFFTIDKESGQIMLARTLDYEQGNDGRQYGTDADEATKAMYKFQVRATDPSGDMAIADITVEVMDRNDAPEISGMSELRVMEEDSDDLLPLNNPDGDLDNEYDGMPDMPARTPGGATTGQVNTYTASDEDAVDQISWSVGGPDGDKFILSADGVEGPNEPRDLMFKSTYTPDFEAPTDANGDNVYKLTVIAWDRTSGYSGRKMDEMEVTVIVENQEETGRIILEEENGVGNEPVAEAEWEPFTDKMVTAAVDDPDQGVAIVTWQWSKSTTGADDSFVVIPGETTASYEPTGEDLGAFLRVTATYIDTYSEQEHPDNPDTTHDERVVEDAAGAAKDPVDEVTDATPAEDGLHGDTGLYRVTATSAFAVRDEDTITMPPAEDAPPVCPDVTVSRSVKENAEEGTFVGAPITEMCTNEPTYELLAGVRDNDYFSITMVPADPEGANNPMRNILNAAETGVDEAPVNVPGWPQITVGSITAPDGVMLDPPLDYEAKGGAPFIVTITAKNDDGEDTFNVSITLEDLNESPWFNQASRDLAASPVMFTENSRDLVATFRATDPDKQSIVWEVTGVDADDFTILNGVLRFKEMPDYEAPTDRVHGALDRNGTEVAATTEPDRMYQITVRATESRAIDSGPDRSDELDVTVSVQNDNEGGRVSLSLLQPEVETALTATASDPDGGVTVSDWQWYRAKFVSQKPALVINPGAFGEVTDASFTDQWEEISGTGDSTGEAASYTPQGRAAQAGDADNETPGELTDPSEHPVDDPLIPAIDEYRYLLVVARYTDTQGGNTEQTAIGTSAYAVRRDVLDANNSSVDFQRNEDTFNIQENDAGKGESVGRVIIPASDDEGDVMTYDLVQPENGQDGVVYDVDFFTIDRATGDISIKMALDHEADDGRTYDGANPATAGEYVITVRATDPSGETEPAADAPNSDDIRVKVNVVDNNDVPLIVNGTVGTPDSLSNRTALARALAKNVELSVNEFNSNLEDGDDGYYTKLGEGTGRENENLFRKIDHDAGDAPKEWRLEGGQDAMAFQIGTPTSGIGRVVEFVTPPDYEMPMDDDGDNVYMFDVVVEDNDGAVGRIPVRVEVMNVREKGMVMLSPEEPTAEQEVTAMLEDPDGVKSITSWMWEKRTSSTGDWEVISGATTDTVTGDIGDFLRVTVEYRDGWSVEDDPITDRVEGATPARGNDERNENDPRIVDSGDNVVDVRTGDNPYDSDERLTEGLDSAVRDPSVPDPLDPETGTGTPPPTIVLTRHVNENVPGTGYVGDPILDVMDAAGYMVEDSGDGQYFRLAGASDISSAYALSDDPDYYTDATDESSRNADTAHENRQAKPGQIALHWDPVPMLDAEGEKSTYTIMVRDPNEPGSSPIELTIIVDDVNEAPSAPDRLVGGLAIGGKTNIRINEGDSLMEDYSVVGGAPGGTAMWTLSGPDVSLFSIDNAGQLTLTFVPDYEDPQDSGPVMNELQVKVDLSFGDDSTSKFVKVEIVNLEEPGMVTVDPMGRPAVDRMITAMLEDPDGVVGTVTWQWASAEMMGGPYTDIDMATMDTYTPMGGAEDDDMDMGDVGMYLMVKAMYTDGHGSGKMKELELTGAVTDELAFEGDMVERMVAEDAMEGDTVGDPVTAAGGLGSTLTYTLSGADMAYFTIDAMTGQIMVGSMMLDHEMKDTYTVDVDARGMADVDGTMTSETAMTTVTIMVGNVDDEGRVTFWRNGADATTAAIMVGDMLTGLAEDPDGNVGATPPITGEDNDMYPNITGATWQWARTMTPAANNWVDIAGETNAAYTVMDTDEGYYLRATAMYDDAEGMEKMAQMMTAAAVGAMPTTGSVLGDRYDAAANGGNGNGQVDVMEMLMAVRDYFAPGSTITVGQMLELVRVYFATS